MSKTYKGSLNLEWYNKEMSILLKEADSTKSEKEIPAPKINWINKDEALFYEIVDDEEGRGLEPFWVPRNDIRIKESRPLIFQKAFIAEEKNKKGALPGLEKEYAVKESNIDDPKIENILIKGDNLLALNTLKKIFDQKPDEEKIKCIYIDPPYNTGSAFEHYDDNLEHSEWLTMMRDRLVILKGLLREDGVILIQIDIRELSNLKLVLDELFGKDNFLTLLSLKVKDVAGVGQESPIFDICEYILIYCKNFELIKNEIIEKSYIYEEINNLIKGYNKYIKKFGKPIFIKEIERSNVGKIKIYKLENYEIEKYDNKTNFKDYISNLDNIFVDYNPSGGMILAIKEHIPKEGLSYIEYIPTKGKDSGKLSKVYFHNRRILSWLKNIVIKQENKFLKRMKQSNLWEINTASLSNEGGVYFPQSKKPEELIKRIIELFSNPNNLILDCFAGSGTTMAVAHKMGRRWIGVEIGKHADTHIIPRLKSVIKGEDPSPISKALKWNGGGSFKYYHLGKSIIDYSKKDFSWTLGKKFIEESFLASYDYVIDKSIKLKTSLFHNEEEKPVIGFQTIGNKTIAGIVTLHAPDEKNEIIIKEEIDDLYQAVKKAKSPHLITIFTNRGVEIPYDFKPDDLEIIKIPQAIFSELEK